MTGTLAGPLFEDFSSTFTTGAQMLHLDENGVRVPAPTSLDSDLLSPLFVNLTHKVEIVAIGGALGASDKDTAVFDPTHTPADLLTPPAPEALGGFEPLWDQDVSGTTDIGVNQHKVAVSAQLNDEFRDDVALLNFGVDSGAASLTVLLTLPPDSTGQPHFDVRPVTLDLSVADANGGAHAGSRRRYNLDAADVDGDGRNELLIVGTTIGSQTSIATEGDDTGATLWIVDDALGATPFGLLNTIDLPSPSGSPISDVDVSGGNLDHDQAREIAVGYVYLSGGAYYSRLRLYDDASGGFAPLTDTANPRLDEMWTTRTVDSPRQIDVLVDEFRTGGVDEIALVTSTVGGGAFGRVTDDPGFGNYYLGRVQQHVHLLAYADDQLSIIAESRGPERWAVADFRAALGTVTPWAESARFGYDPNAAARGGMPIRGQGNTELKSVITRDGVHTLDAAGTIHQQIWATSVRSHSGIGPTWLGEKLLVGDVDGDGWDDALLWGMSHNGPGSAAIPDIFDDGTQILSYQSRPMIDPGTSDLADPVYDWHESIGPGFANGTLAAPERLELVMVNVDEDSSVLMQPAAGTPPLPATEMRPRVEQIFRDNVVMAVIAGPPCSDERQQHGCETGFTTSASSGAGTGASASVGASVWVGFEAETQVGVALGVGDSETVLKLAGRLSFGLDTSVYGSLSATRSISLGHFASQGEDVVLFATTPYNRYWYQVVSDETGDALVGEYVMIDVPLGPRLLAVSREFYNRSNGDEQDIDASILASVPGELTSYPTFSEVSGSPLDLLGSAPLVSVGAVMGHSEQVMELSTSVTAGIAVQLTTTTEEEVCVVGACVGTSVSVGFGSNTEVTFSSSTAVSASIASIPDDPPGFYAENAFSYGLFTTVRTIPVNGRMLNPFLAVNYYIGD